MTAIQIQVPDKLAETARQVAASRGISLEQLARAALAEKISGWDDPRLQARIARGSREKFLKSLERVPDVEPEERDRL